MLVVCVLFPVVGLAGENGPDAVRLALPESRSANPGEFCTLVCRLHNVSSDDLDCLVEAAVPVGWRATSTASRVRVSAGLERPVFVTFQVPDTEAEGDYAVTFRVVDAGGRPIAEELTTIHVNSVYGVRIVPETQAIWLESGQPRQAGLLVENLGNATDTYTISVTHNTEWSVTGLPSSVTVGAGESVRLGFEVSVAPGAAGEGSLIVMVQSEHLPRPAICSYSLRRVHKAEDHSWIDYGWRIPAEASLSAVAGQSSDSIKVTGRLSAHGTYYDRYSLGLGIASADLEKGVSSYYLQYKDKVREFGVGHVGQHLGPLGLMRGVGLSWLFRFGEGTLAGFVGHREGVRRTGVVASYAPSSSVRVAGAASYVDNDGIASQRLGIEVGALLGKRLELSARVVHSRQGSSSGGFSASASARVTHPTGFVQGSASIAEATYAGEGADRAGVGLNAGKQLAKSLYAGVSLSASRDNIAGDQSKPSHAYYSASLTGSTTLLDLVTLSASVGGSQQVDLASNQAISDSRRATVGTSCSIGRVSLWLQAHNETRRDLVSGQIDDLSAYSARLQYRTPTWLSWVYGQVANSPSIVPKGDLLSRASAGLMYSPQGSGLSLWIKWTEKIPLPDVSEKLPESEIELGGMYRTGKWDWHITGTHCREELGAEPWSAELSLGVGYAVAQDFEVGLDVTKSWSSSGTEDMVLGLSLTKRFALPIPGIQAYALVEGVAYIDLNSNGVWDDDDLPVPGVVMKVDTIRARTNEEGRYAFPPLEPGPYTLIVESIPGGLECVTPMPIEIDVSPDETLWIAVQLAEVSSAFGRVQVSPDGKTSELGGTGVPGVVVVAVGQEGSYRTVTNSEGAYYLQVPPGDYSLTLDVRSLPPRYTLTTASHVKVSLSKGERQQVHFGIAPRAREIVFTSGASASTPPVISVSTPLGSVQPGEVGQLTVSSDQKLISVVAKIRGVEGLPEVSFWSTDGGMTWSGPLYVPDVPADACVIEIVVRDSRGKSWTNQYDTRLAPVQQAPAR